VQIRELVVQPLLGMGPITFGTERSEVRRLLGEINLPLYRELGDSDYFGKQASIQIEYADGTASFIGINAGVELRCTLYGSNVFELAAEDLHRHISAHESSPPDFCESENLFLDQIISVYEADEQYDYLGEHTRLVYAQIGIGDERYLSSTTA
jgi:hypothetical protein